jgi:hypothetical protein
MSDRNSRDEEPTLVRPGRNPALALDRQAQATLFNLAKRRTRSQNRPFATSSTEPGREPGFCDCRVSRSCAGLAT